MLFLILLISLLSLGVNSNIKTGPSNTIKMVGETVVLPCVTEYKTCSDIDWAKQEGVQASVALFKSSTGMLNGERYPPERYNVSSVNGCNLTIRDLRLTDSGLFSCSEAKGEHEESRNIILVVIENATHCTTTAENGIEEGTAYQSTCSVEFSASLIKPSKIELTGSSVGELPSSVSSTDANTVELIYARNATPPVIDFKCDVSLSVEQSLPASHDKNSPSLEICALPRINVSHHVTKITCKSGNNVVANVKKSSTVECGTDGFPTPTCECKSNRTGNSWNCGKFTIPETVEEDTYICTATNTVWGIPATVTVFFTVSQGSSFAVGVVIGIVFGVLAVLALLGVLGFCLYKNMNSGKEEKSDQAARPLKSVSVPPEKPPRASHSSNQGDC